MIYLDTSALLKLLVQEDESEALVTWLEEREPAPWLSSALSSVELARACRRLDVDLLPAAESLLAGLDLVPLHDPVLGTAARLPDPRLRSLDALHLATALSLADAVDVVVAYDLRLLAAAAEVGLATASPAA